MNPIPSHEPNKTTLAYFPRGNLQNLRATEDESFRTNLPRKTSFFPDRHQLPLLSNLRLEKTQINENILAPKALGVDDALISE